MSTILSFTSIRENDNSPETEKYNREMLPGDDAATTYAVVTHNSIYTVTRLGVSADGYALVSVVCPPHSVSGDAGGVMFDVVPRILDDRLILVDSDDVRRTVLRTSTIVAVHVLEW